MRSSWVNTCFVNFHPYPLYITTGNIQATNVNISILVLLNTLCILFLFWMGRGDRFQKCRVKYWKCRHHNCHWNLLNQWRLKWDVVSRGFGLFFQKCVRAWVYVLWLWHTDVLETRTTFSEPKNCYVKFKILNLNWVGWSLLEFPIFHKIKNEL